MDVIRKLLLTVGAASAALALAAGPVAAAEAGDEAEAPVEESGTEEPAEDEGKIQLAETPRDRVGLLLLGALIAGGAGAAANARRQLKGKRPQASGEFRWR